MHTEMTSLLTEWYRNGFPVSSGGKFEITDSLCSGQPAQFDENQLRTLIKEEPCQTPRELVQMISSHVTNAHHLHSLRKA